jgi:hypothetical protein
VPDLEFGHNLLIMAPRAVRCSPAQ